MSKAKLVPKRPNPQGGDYRPHYRKREADAYMNHLESTNKVLAAGRRSFNLPSHAWCSQCKRIEVIEWEGINLSSANQDFDGGDVVCKTCHFVIATLYVPWVTPEEPKCGDCMVVHGKSVCTMNCGPAVPIEKGRA